MEVKQFLQLSGEEIAEMYGANNLQLKLNGGLCSASVLSPLAEINRSIDEVLKGVNITGLEADMPVSFVLERPGADFQLGIPLVAVLDGKYIPPASLSLAELSRLYGPACLGEAALNLKLEQYQNSHEL